jgi:uncharacterized membrane protein
MMRINSETAEVLAASLWPAFVHQNCAHARAGLANVTATYVNLLGYEAPSCWVPSLLTVKA